jgi:hypothetical protein
MYEVSVHSSSSLSKIPDNDIPGLKHIIKIVGGEANLQYRQLSITRGNAGGEDSITNNPKQQLNQKQSKHSTKWI